MRKKDLVFLSAAALLGFCPAAGCGGARIFNADATGDGTGEVDDALDIFTDAMDTAPDVPVDVIPDWDAPADMPLDCTPGEMRCGIDGIRERCSDAGVWEDFPCAENEACVGAGDCAAMICERGEKRCDPDDPSRIEVCNTTRTGWELSEICGDDTVCEFGVCVAQSCLPGSTMCTAEGQVRRCNEMGTGYGDPEDCAEGYVCDPVFAECIEIVCTPGAVECIDLARRRVCNFFGSGWDIEDCPDGTACSDGECLERICDPLEKRCDPADPSAWQQCNASGTAWGEPHTCPDGQACDNGMCLTRMCEPGGTICASGGMVRTCNESGTAWGEPEACPDGQACDEGECTDIICTPGDSTCVDPATIRVCNDTGTRYVEEACGDGYVCEDDTCRLKICIPGMRQCSGTTTLEVCNSSGTGWEPAGTCNSDTGERCFEGECQTLCDQAEMADSSIGCRFYAVDLDQYADSGPYAIVVSNTHDSLTASVTIEDRRSGWRTRATQSIAPNSLYTFRISPDQHVENTGVGAGYGYRITSTMPVIAYQFNPIDSASQYSNDASLLLPEHTLDTLYYAAAWKQLQLADYKSYLTVVGTQDGTSVTVRVSTNTAAGGGIPAMSAGGTHTRTINEGDVLNIGSAGANRDLTGSRITASAPVAVFGGCECADVPQNCSWCRTSSGGTLPSSHGSYTCAWCDHVEEQMFPVNTWGTSYIAARVPVRSTGGQVEAAYWRVIASENSTTVTITTQPSVVLRFPSGVVPPYTLNEGEYLEFEMAGTTATPGDALVTANRPILLVQYIEGQECTNRGAGAGGDPAEILMVPQEQYLEEYIFLTPNTYAADYVVVVRETGATITLDGTNIPNSAFTAITADYEVARRSLPDGVHRISGTAPFGIIGVGYSPYVSYGYMGGLSLRVINPL